MKKTILFLVAALFISMSSVAQNNGTAGPLTWAFSGGTLTVSGIGVMPDYSMETTPWNDLRFEIESIVIEDGVTSIGNNAFCFSPALTSLSLSNTVESIGDFAFLVCMNLTSITLPNSLVTIGERAFATTGLTTISIPSSVMDIGSGAFVSSPLTSIVVDEDNPSYSDIDGVLFNKDKVVLVAYPGGKTGTYTIPNSVTTIDESAFLYARLTSLTIPNSVTINKNIFNECRELTSFSVDANNPNYSVDDDVLFNKDKTKLIVFPVSKNEAYTIPNTVETIGELAFSCAVFTSITIPNSVKTIENSAFYDCNKLTSLEIPNSVTTIGDFAFLNCKDLSSVTMPNSLMTIGKGAFQSTGLTSVSIPNSLKAISDSVFYYCFNLTSVTIPSSVKTIGKGAFFSAKLNSVEIPNSVVSIGDEAFSHCPLTSVTMSNSVETVGEYAFYYTGISSITIPASVKTLGSNAFIGCDSLVSIVVDADNTKYSSIDGVLFDKDKTTILIFPEGKKDVYVYAIPGSVTIIGGNAFRNVSLTSVTIPQSVKTIENRAFSNLKNEIKIVVNWPTPLVVPQEVFSKNSFYNALEVPVGTKDLYSTADVWKDFDVIRESIIILEEKNSVGDDNKGDIVLDVKIPADSIRKGSMILRLPDGFTIDKGNTSLAPDFAKLFDLKISDRYDDLLDIEIIPKSSESNGLGIDDAGKMLNIAYNVDESLSNGIYNFVIDNISFESPDGKSTVRWNIALAINVERSGVANELFGESGSTAYLTDNTLYIKADKTEKVAIYTIGGTLLYTATVQPGTTMIDATAFPKGVLVVSGSSGWAKKVIK